MATYTNLILRTINSPFVGNAPDFTRNSVLSHKDVDNNFIFLKGEDIITGSTSGTSIILTQVNTDIIEIDILPILNCPDNFTTGSTLVGHTVVFDTKNSLSAYTVDLSPISGDTNTDNYTTGTTLVGKTIHYDRTDALSAFTTDLSSLFPATDYGNIIFVSEVGPTGLTRSDVVGNINLPVNIMTASLIAQSGDTIHVKSGIYTSTTTNGSGLCVAGVNHYFEPNSHVYKSTSGHMFGKWDGGSLSIAQANVYGSGSFYGSGSCGAIFYDFAVVAGEVSQTYEWDICENTVTSCYGSVWGNVNTILRGKTRIISYGATCIGTTVGNTTIDCPEIISTVGAGISHKQGGGTVGSLKVNATIIMGASGGTGFAGIDVSNHFGDDSFEITASYINSVYAVGASLSIIDLILNVPNVDEVEFGGRHLTVNGHLGYLQHYYGISDIKLLDRFANAGVGVVNATINGDYAANPGITITTLLSSAGNIIHNLKLQSGTIGASFIKYANPRWVSFSGGVLNLLGNWNIDGWAFTSAGSLLTIPNGTHVNIGTTPCPYFTSPIVFGFDSRVSGYITEQDLSPSLGPPIPQSGVTTSPTIFGGIGGTVLNGATVIVRNQDRQIMTTPTSGSTIKIYSGGLNTNKMDAFEAEQEKLRISVTGTSATLTANTETFVSTTGATAAASAAELVVLINASGTVAATASQDVPGVDTYIYIEADVAGDALTIGYGTNTLLDAIVRYNTKAVTDIIGGTLIEDPDIIRGFYY